MQKNNPFWCKKNIHWGTPNFDSTAHIYICIHTGRGQYFPIFISCHHRLEVVPDNWIYRLPTILKNVHRICFKMAVSLVSREQDQMSQGVENRGSLISVPLALKKKIAIIFRMFVLNRLASIDDFDLSSQWEATLKQKIVGNPTHHRSCLSGSLLLLGLLFFFSFFPPSHSFHQAKCLAMDRFFSVMGSSDRCSRPETYSSAAVICENLDYKFHILNPETLQNKTLENFWM